MTGNLEQLLQKLIKENNPEEIATLSTEIVTELSEETQGVFDSLLLAVRQTSPKCLDDELRYVDVLGTVLKDRLGDWEKNTRECIKIILLRNKDNRKNYAILRDAISAKLKEVGLGSILDLYFEKCIL